MFFLNSLTSLSPHQFVTAIFRGGVAQRYFFNGSTFYKGV
ncbi:hypothetical protein HPHPA26_0991 [Helicobacter pylori Hp A-26]|uniref:Uncharacterized protein n=1 Tax=Helicobacter pylori Hp A-26 TaxID=992056 RepID=I9U321_HELPX|nr:hypothetical protein HPHPA26_0991 [Helicobacter pylori Hp A-26]